MSKTKPSPVASTKCRLHMEIKEITAEGGFEGILSPYGNVDGGGDVVERGAYTKTLKERGNKVPLLWQHRSEFPIGTLVLEDREDGLWCNGQLELDLPKAKEAYICLKKRIIKGLSIGFETVKDSIESGIRHLREIRLYEGSVVTFAMNEMAMVTSIKALGNKADFNAELNQIQILNGHYAAMQALSDALRSVIWEPKLSREEKLSAIGDICDQFAQFYTGFAPAYLDALEQEYGEYWAKEGLERKAGAMISATNADLIRGACEKIKSGHDELLGLLDEGKSAVGSEPAGDQSSRLAAKPDDVKDLEAASFRIEEMRALLSQSSR